MSAEDFASWGVDVPRRPPSLPAPTERRPAAAAAAAPARPAGLRSLLRARANAVILDGLVVGVPLLLIDVLMGALFPHRREVLDTRGLGKISFVDRCATDGPAANCLCIYEWLRAQQLPPFITDPNLPKAERALAIDAARCRTDPTRVPA